MESFLADPQIFKYTIKKTLQFGEFFLCNKYTLYKKETSCSYQFLRFFKEVICAK